MKFTNTRTGNIVEGTPTEIAEYHKEMAKRKMNLNPKQDAEHQVKRCTPEKTTGVDFHRQRYSSHERSLMIAMNRVGKSPKTIANKLFREKLCKYKRTPSAIKTELKRMMADPTRR